MFDTWNDCTIINCTYHIERVTQYERGLEEIKSYIYNIERFLVFLNKSRFNLNNRGVKSYLLSQDVGTNTSRLLTV